MRDPHEATQACEKHIQENLQEACRELSAWWKTGLLKGTVIRTAAEHVDGIGMTDPIRFAERLVEQAAVELVAKGAKCP